MIAYAVVFGCVVLVSEGMAWVIPDHVLITAESRSLRLINLVDRVVSTVCPSKYHQVRFLSINRHTCTCSNYSLYHVYDHVVN